MADKRLETAIPLEERKSESDTECSSITMDQSDSETNTPLSSEMEGSGLYRNKADLQDGEDSLTKPQLVKQPLSQTQDSAPPTNQAYLGKSAIHRYVFQLQILANFYDSTALVRAACMVIIKQRTAFLQDLLDL